MCAKSTINRTIVIGNICVAVYVHRMFIVYIYMWIRNATMFVIANHISIFVEFAVLACVIADCLVA